MAKELTNNNTPPVFEQIRRADNEGNEYWSARDLGKVLDYHEYRNFKPVIEKAKEACKNSGQNVEDHFVGFHEMVKIGSGAERGFDDRHSYLFDCKVVGITSATRKYWYCSANAESPFKSNLLI